MRRWLACAVLGIMLYAAPGCGLTREQNVRSEKEAEFVAAIEAKTGQKVADLAADALKKELTELIGEEPKSVTVTPDGKVDIVLTAPLKQAVVEGGEALASKLPGGNYGGAALAAVLAAWAVIQRRRKL